MSAPRRSLAADVRGASIIEFAIVAPVMLLLIMGMADLAYQAYAQAILAGAIQKSARDSAIQGGGDQGATLDARVMAQVRTIAAGATYTSSRKNYDSFSSVRPEPFTDTNGNGVRDAHECFSDVNGNGVWDADPGVDGQGGANDVTRYTMTVTYKQPFPVASLLGWSSTKTISATTLLKNQPYASQAVTAVNTVCT